MHALPQEEKHVHVGKPRFWSEVVWVQGIGPMYLVLGIWSKVFTKGLKLYKKEKLIRPMCASIEYLMKC